MFLKAKSFKGLNKKARASNENGLNKDDTTPTKNFFASWFKPERHLERVKIEMVEASVSPFRYARKFDCRKKQNGTSSITPASLNCQFASVVLSFLKDEEQYLLELDSTSAALASKRTGHGNKDLETLIDDLYSISRVSRAAIESATENPFDCAIGTLLCDIIRAYGQYALRVKDHRAIFSSVAPHSRNINDVIMKPLARLVHYRFYLHRLTSICSSLDAKALNMPVWCKNAQDALGIMSPFVKRIYRQFGIDDTYEHMKELETSLAVFPCKPLVGNNTINIDILLTKPLPQQGFPLPVSSTMLDRIPIEVLEDKNVIVRAKGGRLFVPKRVKGKKMLLYIFSDMFLVSFYCDPKATDETLMFPPIPFTQGKIMANSCDLYEGDCRLVEIHLSSTKMVVAKVNQAAYDRLERACPFLVKNTSTPPKFVPGNVVQPEKKWPSFLRPIDRPMAMAEPAGSTDKASSDSSPGMTAMETRTVGMQEMSMRHCDSDDSSKTLLIQTV